MNVYLIRHGMTPGNELHQYIGGRTDQPLSEQGKTMLSALREEKLYPESDTVFISPMIRCRQTAQILFPGAKLQTVQGLKEMDFGVFEQRSAADMEEDDVYRSWVDGMCEDPIPEGERKADFTERCCKAFQDLMKEFETAETEQAVFVIHGGTIMALLSVFGKPEKTYYDWYVKNGRGYACVWDGTSLHVIREL